MRKITLFTLLFLAFHAAAQAEGSFAERAEEQEEPIVPTDPVGAGDFLLNEVMFNHPEGSCEYIEVMNVSDNVLDASALRFTLRRADGTLTTFRRLDSPCAVRPGDCLAVTEDAEAVALHHVCPPEALIRPMKWTTLHNESATILLTDSAGTTVHDSLTYDASWHHPMVRHEKGVALERISPRLPVQDPASWHSASSETRYGTPGYRNSQYRETSVESGEADFVWLDPEAFSPDNDGWEDVCFIRYRTPAAGWNANVMVFDAVGVEVARLASNALLSTEGFFMWDGTLAGGAAANVGVYVLCFEAFHPQQGMRRVVKKPVVVSGR